MGKQFNSMDKLKRNGEMIILQTIIINMLKLTL